MKKTLLMLAAMAALFACKKADEPVVNPGTTQFVGSVWVEYQGQEYENENIAVDFILSEDKKAADVQINQIRFVPQMPVTVDTVIPVTVSSNGNALTFTAQDNIYPHSPAGVEQTKYQVTSLKGTVTGQELSFSLNFGPYPTRFSGKKN